VGDALRNAFVIEVEDLLTQHEVFEQHEAARASLELILSIRDRDTLIGGQFCLTACCLLVRFATRGSC
jgi:hypothetical protein